MNKKMISKMKAALVAAMAVTLMSWVGCNTKPSPARSNPNSVSGSGRTEDATKFKEDKKTGDKSTESKDAKGTESKSTEPKDDKKAGGKTTEPQDSKKTGGKTPEPKDSRKPGDKPKDAKGTGSKPTESKDPKLSSSADADCQALDPHARLTIICKMIGSEEVVDVCTNKKDRRISPIRVRYLGELADYKPVPLEGKDNPYHRLFTRNVGNRAMRCYQVPRSRVYRRQYHRSYSYRWKRRHYLRRSSTPSTHTPDTSQYATKTWVRENFATKDALDREIKAREEGDTQLKKVMRKEIDKLRRAIQPKSGEPGNS